MIFRDFQGNRGHALRSAHLEASTVIQLIALWPFKIGYCFNRSADCSDALPHETAAVSCLTISVTSDS